MNNLKKILNTIKIKHQFRANICAQAITFIINISAFAATDNYIFIWAEFASVCFLGTHTAKGPKFFDQNILNHFIIVMLFYLSSLLIGSNEELYLLLIFTFTYAFYIFKDCGFNKSINLWSYIQALLIGTTFIAFPFKYKILATIIGYFEAQIFLNLAFLIFKNKEIYLAEPKAHKFFKIKFDEWYSIKKPHVRLALRGSITAVILYASCAGFGDLRPNWAVVSAISALLRDDKKASMRVIKGITIGSLLGWPIASGLISLLGKNYEIATAILWLCLILALVMSFELMNKPNLEKQIMSTVVFLLSVVCSTIAMKTYGYIYLHTKVLNSLIGELFAFIALIVWESSRHWWPKEKKIE